MLKKTPTLQDMIRRYAKELALEEEAVLSAFDSLRAHALSKLAERNKFQTTGIATVKVKVPASTRVRKQTVMVIFAKYQGC